jgi:hypothetical protein
MLDRRVTYHHGGGTISDNVLHRGWDIRYQGNTWLLSSATGMGN